MEDIIGSASELSYLGILLLFVGINAAPLLMPPSWIVLVSFYAIDGSLDPVALSLVGATGATAGRFVLKRVSTAFRRFVDGERRANLDAIGRFLDGKRYGYAAASFLFAVSPLPSNMLFVAYGMMRARSAGLYVGFWLGRALAYYVMISISEAVLTPFLRLFEDRLVGIIVADAVGVCVVLLFMSVDWALLITERKLRLTRPRLWRF